LPSGEGQQSDASIACLHVNGSTHNGIVSEKRKKGNNNKTIWKRYNDNKMEKRFFFQPTLEPNRQNSTFLLLQVVFCRDIMQLHDSYHE